MARIRTKREQELIDQILENGKKMCKELASHLILGKAKLEAMIEEIKDKEINS